MTNTQSMIQMPASCRLIIRRLQEAGFRGYAVGGCVRDSLLGRTPNDWDITTDARPEQVLTLFRDFHVIETGLPHGTVTVMIDYEPFEVTTFRVDGTYSDGRHPDSVQFTVSVEEDLARRDFTVNAMAYNDEDGLIDPFGGQNDLKSGILRCVGNPERRFTEDALRLFRALRFAAKLDFSIEDNTLRALRDLSGKIGQVARERVFTELKQTLTAPHAASALRLAPELVFAAVPELAVLRDVPQNNPYHIYDVWEHTLHALEASPADETVRLAVLFHDVGKGVCRTVDANGRDHFYGHAAHSAKITAQALRHLRCDNRTLHDVTKLTELHDLNFPMRTAKFRRLLASLGYDLFYKLLDVAAADSAGHAPHCIEDRAAALQNARREAERLEAEDACLSMRQLAVNGKDMTKLGYTGREIGMVLEMLLDSVIIGQTPNDREILLTRAEKMQRHIRKETGKR